MISGGIRQAMARLLGWLLPAALGSEALAVDRMSSACDPSLLRAQAVFLEDPRVVLAHSWSMPDWRSLSELVYHPIAPQRFKFGEVLPANHHASLDRLREVFRPFVSDQLHSLGADSEFNVLYPLSSFDLTAPLRIFPEARSIILLDKESVVTPEERRFLLHEELPWSIEGEDRNRDWLVAGPETSRLVLERVLLALKANVPGATLNSLLLFAPRSEEFERLSVMVEFSEAGSAVKRRVFYLAVNLSELNRAVAEGRRHWSMAFLHQLRPKVLMAKGSMTQLGLASSFPWARQYLIQSVVGSSGLLLEGLGLNTRSGERGEFEVTGRDWALQSKIKRFITVEGVDYGYRHADFDGGRQTGDRPGSARLSRF